MNYAPSFIMKVFHLKKEFCCLEKKNSTQQRGFSSKSILNKDANKSKHKQFHIKNPLKLNTQVECILGMCDYPKLPKHSILVMEAIASNKRIIGHQSCQL